MIVCIFEHIQWRWELNDGLAPGSHSGAMTRFEGDTGLDTGSTWVRVGSERPRRHSLFECLSGTFYLVRLKFKRSLTSLLSMRSLYFKVPTCATVHTTAAVELITCTSLTGSKFTFTIPIAIISRRTRVQTTVLVKCYRAL